MANFNRDPESPSHTPKKGVLAVERRKHPRFSVELPLDYCRVDQKDLYGGIVTNAGEGGILVYFPERMEIGAVLRIEIFYARGFQLDTVNAIARVVWSDLATKSNVGEHRYGLEFQYIEEKDFQKLLTLLKEAGGL